MPSKFPPADGTSENFVRAVNPLVYNTYGMIVGSEPCKFAFRGPIGRMKERERERERTNERVGRERRERVMLFLSSDEPRPVLHSVRRIFIVDLFLRKDVLPPENLKRHPGILYSIARWE